MVNNWSSKCQRIFQIASVALVGGLLPCALTAKEPSLRVIGQKILVGEKPGQVMVQYEMVNESNKIITALDFDCVLVDRAGLASVNIAGNDYYYQLLPDARPVKPDLIEPGARVTKTVEMRQNEVEPLGGKTCGPVLVIFDDATYEGPAERAETWFESRANDAISISWATKSLRSHLEKGGSLAAALSEILEAPSNSAETRQRVVGKKQLEGYLKRISSGDEKLDQQRVLNELSAKYENALRNLPETWRAKVKLEVSHD